MNDIELRTLIHTYSKYIENLRSKIKLNKDGSAKQARRIRHLAVLERKLDQALDEWEPRKDRSYMIL